MPSFLSVDRIVPMNLELLFQYMKKHQRVYDPDNRPDYTALRSFSAPPVPQDMDFEETEREGVPGEWIRLRGSRSRHIILFIHGGSFTSLDKGSDRHVCYYLAQRTGAAVYSTNYALAPEHPFPAAPNDCFAVYRSLASEYGAKNIILMGESAGSTLALSLCHIAKNRGIELPKAIVVLSPAVQFVKELPSYTENLDSDCTISNFLLEARTEYFQTTDPKVLEDPVASPLYGDFANFPPTIICASDSEVLKDDAVLLEQRITQSGSYCILELMHNMMHVYPMLIGLKEGREAMERVIAFIKRAF